MEVLVALTIVAIGLSAAAALVFSNLALVEQDTDRVVATNLAREGIEIVKQLRDSNWLAGNNFDTGLLNQASPSDITATPVWDGVIDRPSLDFTANAITDAEGQVVLSAAAGAVEGFMANKSNISAITGSNTPFRRLLSLSSICVDAGNTHAIVTGPCPAGQYKAGIRVESRIQWTRRARILTTMMYDDLYDWK